MENKFTIIKQGILVTIASILLLGSGFLAYLYLKEDLKWNLKKSIYQMFGK